MFRVLGIYNFGCLTIPSIYQVVSATPMNFVAKCFQISHLNLSKLHFLKHKPVSMFQTEKKAERLFHLFDLCCDKLLQLENIAKIRLRSFGNLRVLNSFKPLFTRFEHFLSIAGIVNQCIFWKKNHLEVFTFQPINHLQELSRNHYLQIYSPYLPTTRNLPENP